jgi:hypothetical protein
VLGAAAVLPVVELVQPAARRGPVAHLEQARAPVSRARVLEPVQAVAWGPAIPARWGARPADLQVLWGVVRAPHPAALVDNGRASALLDS